MDQTEFLRKNKSALESFSALSHEIGGSADFTQGGGGNTSVKLQDNIMAIKASGYRLVDILPDDGYALMDYQGVRSFYAQNKPTDLEDVEKAGNAHAQSTVVSVTGIQPKRPSVESGFHALLLDYVVHVHCVYANLLTCSIEGRQLAKEFFSDAAYTYGYVDYCNPGTLLSFNMYAEAQRVAQRTGKAPNVLFMQNHGVTVTHDDPSQCKSIFLDVCDRCARAFSVRREEYPVTNLRQIGEHVFRSCSDYAQHALQGTDISGDYFYDTAIYPDQLVYLAGNVAVLDTDESDKKITINRLTGEITYRASEREATAMDETILAVLYVINSIESSPYTLSTMSPADKAFISGWESEHYRQRIVNK